LEPDIGVTLLRVHRETQKKPGGGGGEATSQLPNQSWPGALPHSQLPITQEGLQVGLPGAIPYLQSAQVLWVLESGQIGCLDIASEPCPRNTGITFPREGNFT
jgi:hypothetical protein